MEILAIAYRNRKIRFIEMIRKRLIENHYIIDFKGNVALLEFYFRLKNNCKFVFFGPKNLMADKIRFYSNF